MANDNIEADNVDRETAALLERFHELRNNPGVKYVGTEADPSAASVRAWLMLALTLDERLREIAEGQTRIIEALERLVDVGIANAVDGGLP